MKKILFFRFIFLFLGFPFLLFSQNLPLGLNPNRLSWQQINTPQASIIFPEGFEKQAERIAHLIGLQASANRSIGLKNIKISLILHNLTTTPNGFVALAPWRSEYYATPPQLNFTGTNHWLDLLSIHEYRHVQQRSNSLKGITKIATYLFGELAWAGMTGLALPRWYAEGDAVGTETALSEAGRGRQPDFEMEYRALALAQKKYHYEKASANSYKHFVPNYYNLGYYLTTFARREYGAEIWKDVLDDAVRYKGVFYPFSRSLRKRTGLKTKDLYQKTFEHLYTKWQKEDSLLEVKENDFWTLKKKKEVWVSYRNPQFIDNQTVISEKNSFSNIRNLYQTDSAGNEKRILTLGLGNPSNNTLSVSQGKMVWTEQTFDERWENQEFSVIQIYDTKTQKLRKLSPRSRFFAPALSHKADRIVAVRITPEQKYSLVILDSNNGKILLEIPNSSNHFYSFPRWANEKTIVAVVQNDQGNALQRIDLENFKQENLIPFTFYQISNPAPSGKWVYFSGAYTGINNIFAVSLELPKSSENTNLPNPIYQITNVRLGAFQPCVSPDGKTLVFSEFSIKGYDLRKISLKEKNWKLYNSNMPSRLDFYKPLVEQEGLNILEKIKLLRNDSLKITKYRKSSRLFNLHSTQLFASHPLYLMEVYANNVFSTFSAVGSYLYNFNDRFGQYSLDLNYGQFYPIFHAGTSYSRRISTMAARIADSNGTRTLLYDGVWFENKIYAGFTLPFTLTHRSYLSQLRLSSYYNFLLTDFTDRINDGFRDTYSQSLQFRLRFHRSQLSAYQNLFPRFAQTLHLDYQQIVGSGVNQGRQFLANSNWYFPSFFRNHSLYFNLAYQTQDVLRSYKFANLFFYPRGYNPTFRDVVEGKITAEQHLQDQMFKISGNYAFPLLYPDLKLGGLFFLKRLKMNLFYDYGQASLENKTVLMRSAGAELGFDVRIFRLLELDFALRYSYLLDARRDRQTFEVVFLRFNP